SRDRAALCGCPVAHTTGDGTRPCVWTDGRRARPERPPHFGPLCRGQRRAIDLRRPVSRGGSPARSGDDIRMGSRPPRGTSRAGILRENHMSKQKGGTYIAEALVREKIPYIFGVCGHGTVGLIDCLHEVKDEVPMISPRHEQTAVHMADGFFRVSHKVAATLTSTGPGSCNQIMGLRSRRPTAR